MSSNNVQEGACAGRFILITLNSRIGKFWISQAVLRKEYVGMAQANKGYLQQICG